MGLRGGLEGRRESREARGDEGLSLMLRWGLCELGKVRVLVPSITNKTLFAYNSMYDDDDVGPILRIRLVFFKWGKKRSGPGWC